MNPIKLPSIACFFAAMIVVIPFASAARKALPALVLTAQGQQLEAKYSDMLASLQKQVAGSLPAIDAEQQSAFMTAYAAEGAVRSDDGKKSGLRAAEAVSLEAAAPLLSSVDKLLASSTLDAKLIKCSMLANATPAGLASFAQQGSEETALLQQLLGDAALMSEMLTAGGAKGGQYGRAMQIYSDILKASPNANKGILHRLAIGTSLEQAVSAVNRTEGGQVPIDPVKRYLNYEKAFLKGELDPAFPTMTAWECRFITNDPFTDEELSWCREMMRNYYPEHILTPDYRWRYVRIVRTDVGYSETHIGAVPGSMAAQYINGGGKCGPRAFIGRLAARAFGIPAWGVRQPGHAALSHWTPDGWTICLGAGWEVSYWDDRTGLDFLLEAQARSQPQGYMKVLRAQWIGDSLGEKKVDSFKPGTGGFWNALALNESRSVVATAKPRGGDVVGQELGEKFESTQAQEVMSTPIAPADKKIVVDSAGVITIPAVACSKPTRNSADVEFMKSFLGGMQLRCNWQWPQKNGKAPEGFEYTVNAPAGGAYLLTARIVTVHKENQHLLLTPSGAQQPIDLAIPYTAGMWKTSDPVQITLLKGSNLLHFARPVPSKGLTIKDFTFTPAK